MGTWVLINARWYKYQLIHVSPAKLEGPFWCNFPNGELHPVASEFMPGREENTVDPHFPDGLSI